MPKLSVAFHQIKMLPPKVLLTKLMRLAKARLSKGSESNDIPKSGYLFLDCFTGLQSVLNTPDLSQLSPYDKANLTKIADDILSHKFKLLGSKSLTFAYTEDSPGFEDFNYSRYSRQKPVIPSHLLADSERISSKIPKSYKLIPWNKDMISGYQWNLDRLGKELEPAPELGVDIKNPWELGRLQLLPKLALAFNLIKDSDSERAQKLLSEFHSQIYDFRGNCPAFLGVQWSSAMDVGIRMVNILLAWDWFTAEESPKKKVATINFEQCLEEMCREHLTYLLQHIEYADGQPNNHYFANICSVLIISLYLNTDENYHSLSRWALSKLAHEIDRQFLEDGANFEGSTAYHLFTTEMMMVALTAISNLSQKDRKLISNPSTDIPPHFAKVIGKTKYDNSDVDPLLFPEKHVESRLYSKIEKIFSYSKSITENLEMYPLFGDEDGGSYIDLNLFPEKHKKNRHYDIAVNPTSIYALFYAANLTSEFLGLYKAVPTQKCFHKSGLYQLRSENIMIWIKNSSLGLYGRGGHNHNDNLSFVLNKKGNEVITDPGTYCYTSHPNLRNKFRSVEYHNTPQINEDEINTFGTSISELFWFRDDKTKLKTHTHNEFSYIGSHCGYGKELKRALMLTDNSLLVKDEYYGKVTQFVSRLHLHPQISARVLSDGVELHYQGRWIAKISADTEIFLDEYWHSASYGTKEKAKVIVSKTTGNIMNWNIAL